MSNQDQLSLSLFLCNYYRWLKKEIIGYYGNKNNKEKITPEICKVLKEIEELEFKHRSNLDPIKKHLIESLPIPKELILNEKDLNQFLLLYKRLRVYMYLLQKCNLDFRKKDKILKSDAVGRKIIRNEFKIIFAEYSKIKPKKIVKQKNKEKTCTFVPTTMYEVSQ